MVQFGLPSTKKPDSATSLLCMFDIRLAIQSEDLLVHTSACLSVAIPLIADRPLLATRPRNKVFLLFINLSLSLKKKLFKLLRIVPSLFV